MRDPALEKIIKMKATVALLDAMIRICLAVGIVCGIAIAWVHLSEREQCGSQIR